VARRAERWRKACASSDVDAATGIDGHFGDISRFVDDVRPLHGTGGIEPRHERGGFRRDERLRARRPTRV
jgi:hypothetical protein